MATFKKFRKDEIQITPYEAHKEYLVYVSDYTGSYHEPYYAQSRIYNHPLTSSDTLREAEVSLSVYCYDAVNPVGAGEGIDDDFFPDEFGKYGAILSASGHIKTTNGYFSRAMHSSLQGMYYTNPDDPCYTLDNSGYEKEYRELNTSAQILSIPQRMFGDNIHKGSIKITSGSGANRITIYDDGFGNLYDHNMTGSADSGSVTSGSVLNYVSKSLFSLNFNDMHSDSGKRISAHSINAFNTFTQDRGDKFSIKNTTRFFERSKYANEVELYNCTPDATSSTSNGTVLRLDGIDQTTVEGRTAEESQSMMIAKHNLQFGFRQSEDYTVHLRLSASNHQPSSESVDATGPHQYIVSKLDDVKGGSFPFSIKLCNNHADGTSAQGIPGGIQASIHNGIFEQQLDLNSTTNITGSTAAYHNVVFVKTGSIAELYINGNLEATGPVPKGRLHNSDDIIIGARTAWKGKYTKGSRAHRGKARKSGGTYNRTTKPEIEYFRSFRGTISNIMIFSGGLSSKEISYGQTTNGTFSNHVGNIFYNHGIIALTDTDAKYKNVRNMLSECTLSFKNSHTIFEHEYSCHIKEREYTTTMNPSIIENDKTGEIKHFVTQSSWAPYITTIGLYDSQARLLAIGKLSKPIKKSDEYDTTFIVRYDT
mgnify:CR=1 FL=1